MGQDSRVNRSKKRRTNKKVNKKTNKKKLINQICKFIVFQAIFIGVTSPFMFLYGPFKTLRSTVINTVLATRHAYLVDKFIPKSVLSNMSVSSKNSDSLDNTIQDTKQIEVKYKNSNEITVTRLETPKFDAYLMEVKNPLRLRVGLTTKLNTEGEKTSVMAEKNGAVAAINGGSFLDRGADGTQFAGTGALPGGFVIIKGEVKYSDTPKDKKVTSVIGITKAGELIIGSYSINELMKMGISEAVCFTPANLIRNGKPLIKDRGEGGLNPRTAIGQRKDGTILLLVTDGRKNAIQMGASLFDIQQLLLEKGAVNAANLDGGYSATMYYNGEIVNIPNSWDGERSVATCFLVEP